MALGSIGDLFSKTFQFNRIFYFGVSQEWKDFPGVATVNGQVMIRASLHGIEHQSIKCVFPVPGKGALAITRNVTFIRPRSADLSNLSPPSMVALAYLR